MKQRTICFDLRALQIGHENRGIGMYIKSILEHLPKDNNKYLLYFFDSNNPLEDLGINLAIDYTIITTRHHKTIVESPRDILTAMRLIFHHFKSVRKQRPDVIVQFDASLGMPRWRKLKKIVIGYDLIPLIMRKEYNPTITYAWKHALGKRAKLRAPLRAAYYNFKYWMIYRIYKRSDQIVCISKASAESFKTILGINETKIISIPLAPVLPEATNVPDPDVKKPYIFYIGGTDARKQVTDIVKAYNIVRGRGNNIALVFAGNEFAELEKIPDIEARQAILKSPYKEDIHLAGFVNDEEKVQLYKGALAFIFTSRYEGFGIPILEAMYSACPVIAYNNSSIPEAAGNAANLVETGNFVEVAKNIIALFRDDQLSKKRVRDGVRWSKRFNWDIYVKDLKHAFEA